MRTNFHCSASICRGTCAFSVIYFGIGKEYMQGPAGQSEIQTSIVRLTMPSGRFGAPQRPGPSDLCPPKVDLNIHAPNAPALENCLRPSFASAFCHISYSRKTPSGPVHTRTPRYVEAAQSRRRSRGAESPDAEKPGQDRGKQELRGLQEKQACVGSSKAGCFVVLISQTDPRWASWNLGIFVCIRYGPRFQHVR